MEGHLETLEEYVKDEDKIVTVPYLASNLNVSIQESQKLLDKYVELYGKSNTLSASYVLNGTLLDSNKNVICFVKDSELDEKKKLFNSNLHFNVYSIQKSQNIDFNIIALADKITEQKVREKALLGSVISKNCVKRVLKLKKLPPPPPPAFKGKSSFFTKPPGEKSSEKITSEDVKPKVQGGIASMFNKAASNGTTKKSEEKVTIKSSPKQTGKISGFFTKSSSSSSISKNSAKSEDSVKTENIIDELMDVDFDEDLKENIEDKNVKKEKNIDNGKPVKKEDNVDKEKSVKKEEEKPIKKEDNKKTNDTKTKTVAKNDKKKKRNRSNSEDRSSKQSKRRKRIIVRDESDSDDIFEKEESDADIVESSEEEPEKAPTVTVKKLLAPKNKKRIAVEKNYMDDEGFVVTKTEYEYVSASEDEEIIKEPLKVEEKPKPNKILEKKTSSTSENDDTPAKKQVKGKKGKKPVSNGSQPTLMSFFQKK